MLTSRHIRWSARSEMYRDIYSSNAVSCSFTKCSGTMYCHDSQIASFLGLYVIMLQHFHTHDIPSDQAKASY